MSSALLAVPGVWKVSVNFDDKEAQVEFDAKLANVDQMSAALEEGGFQGSLKSWPES